MTKLTDDYIQDKLNTIWDSIGTDEEFPTSQKITDDAIENTMVIGNFGIQINVIRKPGEKWRETGAVTDDSVFK